MERGGRNEFTVFSEDEDGFWAWKGRGEGHAGGQEALMLMLPFMMMFIGLAIAATVFWIIALVDCLSNEPSAGNDKLIWALVIVFLHWIGALLYFLVRKPQRVAQFGR